MNITTCLNAVKLVKNKLFGGVKNAVAVGFSPRYLLYTNVGISLGLSGVGDFLLQRYEMAIGRQDVWDKQQTRNMSASGLTIGVMCHYWYIFLDRRFPGATLRIVMKKLLVDQAICSPMCIATLFITVGLLEGQSPRDICAEAKQKAWLLYTAEWIIWPPAQFINFYLLPTKYRIIYDNTISLGYDVYTSYIKNRYHVETDKVDTRVDC